VKTSGGLQAEQITRWAWDDPADRIVNAIDRVNALARFSESPGELREIQDQGAYLYRLADSMSNSTSWTSVGSLVPPPAV
jgi:hypothetical protein